MDKNAHQNVFLDITTYTTDPTGPPSPINSTLYGRFKISRLMY